MSQVKCLNRLSKRRITLIALGVCLIVGGAGWYFYQQILELETVGKSLADYLVRHPDDMYGLLGKISLDEKNYSDALKYYKKASANAPNDPVWYVRLAEAYWENGKPDKAIIECRRAIKLDPKYGPAYLQLGVALFVQKRPDEGIEALKQFEKTVRPENGYSEETLQRVRKIIVGSERR